MGLSTGFYKKIYYLFSGIGGDFTSKWITSKVDVVDVDVTYSMKSMT